MKLTKRKNRKAAMLRIAWRTPLLFCLHKRYREEEPKCDTKNSRRASLRLRSRRSVDDDMLAPGNSRTPEKLPNQCYYKMYEQIRIAGDMQETCGESGAKM